MIYIFYFLFKNKMGEKIVYNVFHSYKSDIFENNVEIIVMRNDVKDLKLEVIKDIFTLVNGLNNPNSNLRGKKYIIYNQDNLRDLKIKDFHKTKEYNYDLPINQFPSNNIHIHFCD